MRQGENECVGQFIESPLILVPAVLALEALNSPYTLSKHENDIVAMYWKIEINDQWSDIF